MINIEKFVIDYVNNHGYVSDEQAINKDMAGLKIFDEPIVGYADASDNLFYKYKEDKSIIGGKFIPPNEWLSEAATVISIFFPFSKRVKETNGKYMDLPSPEWLHGRIEGQSIIRDCTAALVTYLQDSGFTALAPCLDKRVWAQTGNENAQDNSNFLSNWSERHVAYVSGLGTFSLSKGLITKKGVAGRFTSIVTNYSHEAVKREYNDIYEYCNNCGKCIKNCPASAISFEDGKQHYPCMVFLDKTELMYLPRYGCGKCQVNVPCQDGIPIR